MELRCVSIFAVVIMMMIMVGLMTAVVVPSCVTEDLCVLPIKHSGVTASCWLGFDWESTLGYDGEGPPSGLEKMHLVPLTGAQTEYSIDRATPTAISTV